MRGNAGQERVAEVQLFLPVGELLHGPLRALHDELGTKEPGAEGERSSVRKDGRRGDGEDNGEREKDGTELESGVAGRVVGRRVESAESVRVMSVQTLTGGRWE